MIEKHAFYIQNPYTGAVLTQCSHSERSITMAMQYCNSHVKSHQISNGHQGKCVAECWGDLIHK